MLRVLGLALVAIIGLLAILSLLFPRDSIDREISFDPKALPDDLDAYLAASEAQFSDITPGTAKRIVWAGATGARTPFAVLYIHGFSATSEEIRPVPDRLAAALEANLYFARLAGHGRPGSAMGEATAGDWMEDIAEALAIGRRLGDRVIVIGTSTGATLAAIAATDATLAQDIAGIAMVSPNFKVRSAASVILDLPLARWWGPLVAGKNIGFTPVNAAHGRFWTTTYPSIALFPMAALLREARNVDYAAAGMPLMVIFCATDKVIDPAAIPAVTDAWRGPVTLLEVTPQSDDDPYHHVIAGDVLSPGQTAPVSEALIAWAEGF